MISAGGQRSKWQGKEWLRIDTYVELVLRSDSRDFLVLIYDALVFRSFISSSAFKICVVACQLVTCCWLS